MGRLEDLDTLTDDEAQALREADYGSTNQLEDADPADIANDVDGISEDRAATLVNEAQNFEEGRGRGRSDEAPRGRSDAGTDDQRRVEDEDGDVTVHLEMEGRGETSAYNALQEVRDQQNERGNDEAAEALGRVLDKLGQAGSRGQVELTADELNEAHAALERARTRRSAEGMSDEELEQIRHVELQLNEVREEELFE